MSYRVEASTAGLLLCSTVLSQSINHDAMLAYQRTWQQVGHVSSKALNMPHHDVRQAHAEFDILRPGLNSDHLVGGPGDQLGYLHIPWVNIDELGTHVGLELPLRPHGPSLHPHHHCLWSTVLTACPCLLTIGLTGYKEGAIYAFIFALIASHCGYRCKDACLAWAASLQSKQLQAMHEQALLKVVMQCMVQHTTQQPSMVESYDHREVPTFACTICPVLLGLCSTVSPCT